MKKRRLQLLLFFCVLLLPSLTTSQNNGPWEQMVSTLKDPHVSASTIDGMLSQLQAIEKMDIASKDSQQVALDIFLQASYAYARNFHFKQGLYVYQGYLVMKDKFALLDKTKAIAEMLMHNSEQQKNLNTELTKKKNTAGQLDMDIASWKKINGKFSRNYSLVVILLTAVLALVFIRLNMNTVKAKQNLQDNRKNMLQMQRVAVLGRFYEGAVAFLKSSCNLGFTKAGEFADSPGTNAKLSASMKQFQQTEKKLESLLN